MHQLLPVYNSFWAIFIIKVSFIRYKLKVAKCIGKISGYITTGFLINFQSASNVDETILGKVKLCEF